MHELSGVIRLEGDASTITMEVTLGAAPEHVWEAIVDKEHTSRWLGSLSGDLEEGGDYRIVFHEDDPAAQVSGAIRRCVPGHELVITWQAPGEPTSLVTVRLAAHGAGTRLHLTHADLRPPASGTGHAAGWQVHLEQLAAGLADGDWRDRWQNWAALERAYADCVVQQEQ